MFKMILTEIWEKYDTKRSVISYFLFFYSFVSVQYIVCIYYLLIYIMFNLKPILQIKPISRIIVI